MKHCALLATVGDPGNGADTAEDLAATGLAGNPDTASVETKNRGGGLTPGILFHPAVVRKGAPSTSRAAVAASGLPVPGSSLTSSLSSATGTFTVVTDQASLFSACATVATPARAASLTPQPHSRKGPQ